MVKFTEYWESMVAHKPEWRRAFVDYPTLNKIVSQLKAEVKARALDPSTGVTRQYDVFPTKSAAGDDGNDNGNGADDAAREPGSGRAMATLRKKLSALGGGDTGSKAGDSPTRARDRDQDGSGRGGDTTTDADDDDMRDLIRGDLTRNAAAARASNDAARGSVNARGGTATSEQADGAAAAEGPPSSAFGTNNDSDQQLRSVPGLTGSLADPLCPPAAQRNAAPIPIRKRGARGAGPGRSGPHVFTPPPSFMMRFPSANVGQSAATAATHEGESVNGLQDGAGGSLPPPLPGLGIGGVSPMDSPASRGPHGGFMPVSPSDSRGHQTPTGAGRPAPAPVTTPLAAGKPMSGPFRRSSTLSVPEKGPAFGPFAKPVPAAGSGRPPAYQPPSATKSQSLPHQHQQAPPASTSPQHLEDCPEGSAPLALKMPRGARPAGEPASALAQSPPAVLTGKSLTTPLQGPSTAPLAAETPPPLSSLLAGGSGALGDGTTADVDAMTPQGSAAFGDGEWGSATGTTTAAGRPPLEYILSLHGRDLARQFEELLVSEVRKCSRWGKKAAETFADYVVANRKGWEKSKNVKKSKFAMRHVYEEVNHLHTFCDTNVLAVKTALKKYGHSQPEGMGESVTEEALLEGLAELTDEVDGLRRDIELMFSKNFGGGDVRQGMSSLRGGVNVPFISAKQAFRAGSFFAGVLSIILYWVHVYAELRPSHLAIESFNHAFPVFRLLLSITFAFVVWSWVLRICNSQRINYLYVFEFSQTTTVTWMACLEYSLLLTCVVLLAGVLHLRLQITHPYVDETNAYESAAPYSLVVATLLIILAIVIPPRHVLRNTRNAFWRVLRKCMRLPFGYVRFVEFFVADWGTSLPQPLTDLVFTLCFYTGEAKFAFGDPSAWHGCTEVTKHWNYPVTAIPYFWRACQTLKMFLRTRQRLHLVNHGKYMTFLIHFLLDWIFAFLAPHPVTRFFSEFFHFAAELYAFVWDVLMDWGFIRGRRRQRMFRRTWIYVAAAAFDCFARFFYLPAALVIAPHVSKEWLVLFQSLLEIFRRANWSIFRIENENVNNLETYRSIDFVPEVTLPDPDTEGP